MTPARTSGFTSFDFPDEILRALDDAGYEEPREIQAKTLAAALDGRDVLGLAETGCGKTAAFALPMIDFLTEERRPGPRALVVAPTRELAIQIETELRMLARHTKLTSVVIFGGVNEKPQIRALGRNPDVVVACPGRLLDLHGRGLLRLDRVEVLVLDEADHMFDMGFLPDVRRILRALPDDRQNLLFSATMPPEIRQLADQVLDKPHVVELAHSAPASSVDMTLIGVPGSRKRDLLDHLLDTDGVTKAIVFTRTKHRAKRLAKQLSAAGRSAVALQGNMSQNARQRAMTGFRDGSYDILVATDIAARGIDVARVSHVINFDMPNTVEAYTHRVGRTGRSELSGIALTFVCEDDLDMVRDIERKLDQTLPRRTVPGFEGLTIPETRAGQGPRPGNKKKRRSGGGRRRGGRGRQGGGRQGGGRQGGGRQGGGRQGGARQGGGRQGGGGRR